ncbi:MAG: hypothetical protein ACLFR0_06610 [Alphaproteobacteria bacterium]
MLNFKKKLKLSRNSEDVKIEGEKMNTTAQYPRPHYIKRNLLATLETALFMKQGAERFSVSKAAMKRSFLIPLLVLPLSVATMIAAHPEGSELSQSATYALAIMYGLRTVLYLTGFMGFIYIMAKSLNRVECFARMVTANNFLTLPAALLMLPLSLAFMNGVYSWEEVYPLMICITFYSYAYTAFMAAHVLRVPMELAVFVAVCSMAIHQSALDAVKWIGAQGLQMLA